MVRRVPEDEEGGKRFGRKVRRALTYRRESSISHIRLFILIVISVYLHLNRLSRSNCGSVFKKGVVLCDMGVVMVLGCGVVWTP